MAAKIRKGDKVVVVAGRDKGRTGEVIEVRPDEGGTPEGEKTGGAGHAAAQNPFRGGRAQEARR
jgi:ribosomal protein L24